MTILRKKMSSCYWTAGSGPVISFRQVSGAFIIGGRSINTFSPFTCIEMEEPGFLTIRDLLFSGNQNPDNPAIESPGYEPMTFQDLRKQVRSVVQTLNGLGYRRNDRIAVVMPDGPAAAVMIIAVMAGFTSIPLNPRSTGQESAALFSHLKITAVVVQEGSETPARQAAEQQKIRIIRVVPDQKKAGMFRLEPVPSRITVEAEFSGPGDIATLVITSGTTALPKIIPYSQRLMAENAYRNLRIFRYAPDDRSLHILPLFHLFGLTAVLYPLFAGVTVICTRDFISRDFLPLLRTTRANCYGAVPALHQAIHAELKKAPPEALSEVPLRFMVTGSSYLSDVVRQELEAMLQSVMVEVYGMSEALYISVNRPYRNGSAGIPVIESLRIVDENGITLAQGKEGEIHIRGAGMFSGYENAPEETAAVFSGGWFRTGDVGYLDPDGYLFITGRVKEQINKGGEKISPKELDLVLCSHPGIRDAMAFPVRDPALGEDIAAMVVRDDDTLTEDAIRFFLLDHVAPSKVPRRIFFTDAIPKTPNGKSLRSAGTRQYS